MLTYDELRRKILYDRETGIFLRRKLNGDIWKVAGNVKMHGYRIIMINRVEYRANRLAWLYVTGEWPEHYVDHINNNPSDDRFVNLRAATHSQNLANAKRPVTNTSGYKGVSFHKASGLWHARVKKDRKTHSLGYYKNPQDAHQAYLRAAKKLYGNFARGE